MRLKATFLATLFALVLAATCATQAKQKPAPKPRPDLNGTWVLDKSRSYIDGAVRAKLPYDEVRVVIAQSEAEIKINYAAIRDGRRIRFYETAYADDGRASKHQIFTTGHKEPYELSIVESSARWDGERLVLNGVERETAPGGDGTERHFTDTWELSKDGRTLKQTTTSFLTERGGSNTSNRMGQSDVRRVYVRAQ